jgi:hypothetical protein
VGRFCDGFVGYLPLNEASSIVKLFPLLAVLVVSVTVHSKADYYCLCSVPLSKRRGEIGRNRIHLYPLSVNSHDLIPLHRSDM